MNISNSQIIDKLKKASDGLLWMSESEYPFEPFLWESVEGLTADKLLQQVGKSPDTPVRVTDIDNFFSNAICLQQRSAIASQDWYDDKQREEAKKCRHLLETLKTNLTNTKVYCVGKVEIDVYIVGKTPDGDLAGVSTMVVET